MPTQDELLRREFQHREDLINASATMAAALIQTKNVQTTDAAIEIFRDVLKAVIEADK